MTIDKIWSNIELPDYADQAGFEAYTRIAQGHERPDDREMLARFLMLQIGIRVQSDRWYHTLRRNGLELDDVASRVLIGTPRAKGLFQKIVGARLRHREPQVFYAMVQMAIANELNTILRKQRVRRLPIDATACDYDRPDHRYQPARVGGLERHLNQARDAICLDVTETTGVPLEAAQAACTAITQGIISGMNVPAFCDLPADARRIGREAYGLLVVAVNAAVKLYASDLNAVGL